MKEQPDQHQPGLVTPSPSLFQPLPVLTAIVLLAAGAGAGMSSVFAWIHNAWWSFAGVGVYSHGYLVLGMSIWMGWAFWLYDPPRRLAPNWWLLAPLLALVAILAAMELLYINSGRVLLVPLLLIAAIGLVFGGKACRRLAVPALFLYFALLPFWLLDPILQAIATQVVGWMIVSLSIPAYIEGNFIHVAAGIFEIASACSGLSFLLTAVTLATFYGAMYLHRWPSRGLLLAIAAGAAVVSNWIRIWSLVLIGHYTEIQHWLINEHYLYGWLLFVIAMAPVLYLAKWLEDREPVRRAMAREAAAPGPATGSGSNQQELNHSQRQPVGAPGTTRVASKAVICAAALGGLLLLLPRFFVAAEINTVNATEPLPLPARLGKAEQITAPADWHPVFHHAREGRASYRWDDAIIHVYRAVYPQQNRSHHLFLRGNSLVGENWQPAGQGTQFVVRVNSEDLTVVEFRGRPNGQEHLVWAWYKVAGQPATSRLGAKLIEARETPRGRSDGVAMALSVPCDLDCEPSRHRLQAFLQAALSDIQRPLGTQESEVEHIN